MSTDREKELEQEVARLDALINNPHTDDFLEAVRLEAAHQKERWKSTDPDKQDVDWFWLIGYLSGKAIRPEATKEKRLHHIITTAAACLNWHASAVKEEEETKSPRVAELEAELKTMTAMWEDLRVELDRRHKRIKGLEEHHGSQSQTIRDLQEQVRNLEAKLTTAHEIEEHLLDSGGCDGLGVLRKEQ